MPFIPNPFTGKLDYTAPKGIPQLDSDPASPSAEEAWVLKTTSGGSGGGEIYGMLGLSFPLVTAGAQSTTYQLSYRTKEATTIRVSLS